MLRGKSFVPIFFHVRNVRIMSEIVSTILCITTLPASYWLTAWRHAVDMAPLVDPPSPRPAPSAGRGASLQRGTELGRHSALGSAG